MMGEVLCWMVAAAATDSPTLDRTAAGVARRKIEENSLTVVAELGLKRV